MSKKNYYRGYTSNTASISDAETSLTTESAAEDNAVDIIPAGADTDSDGMEVSPKTSEQSVIEETAESEIVPSGVKVSHETSEQPVIEETAESEIVPSGVKVSPEMPIQFAPEETEDITDITIDETEEPVDNVVKLSKRYRFEGRIIDTVDLSEIVNASAITLQKIENIYRKKAKNTAATPELTLDYALVAASVITDLPLEFYKHISGKDAIKIKNRVVNFLYSEV